MKGYKDNIYLAIGVFGACITLFGLFQNLPQAYYVVGSFFLLITALYYKLDYFIALEIILMAGHATILLSIGQVLQIVLPILLCVQLLVYYFLSGQSGNFFLLIGIIGIALISIGFSYVNQWIFFTGSSAIALYAYSTSVNNKIALLWTVLNSLFAIIAIVKLITLYF